VKEVKNVRVNLEPLIRKKSIKLYNVPDKLAQVDSYKGDILSALMNYFECELTDLFDVEYAAPVADVADDGSKRRNIRSKS
jgi:hypothetical protein